jgi:hypothetical protein
MVDKHAMEPQFISAPSSLNVSLNDVQFQVSLLRLMYPGAASASQVAELERMRQPVEAALSRI